jgi:serine protease Do
MASRIVKWMSCIVVAGCVGSVSAQAPFTTVIGDVNKRMCKLFGAGGFKGLPSYGTGIMVSSKGYILTVNNHILTTQSVLVHLYDGRVYNAKVIAREPELDVALLKIEADLDFLPHYDIEQAVKQPLGEIGDWILAFSNQFKIATRDEPMTVQRGVISGYSELRGKRGVFDAPYSGDVYFVDVISNNPGAAGGILTNRKGQILGIVGRELKNTLTDTWINYAVPVQAKVEFKRDDKNVVVDLPTFIREGIEGKYKQSERAERKDLGGYTGIILVANPVTATPPYIEEVVPGSPAAKAGLRPDDLILYVDGELVSNITAFREIMKQVAPGKDIKLEVQRGNRLESVKLHVIEKPKQMEKK